MKTNISINKKTGKDFVIFWSVYKGKPRVYRILLSKNCRLFPDSVILSCPQIDRLAKQITAFLNGRKIRFSLDIVLLDLCPDFQKKVLLQTAAITSGKTCTYQVIANRLGKPRAWRAVGSALAGNPFPIVIPCHRIVRSDGTFGNYQGGNRMKELLLMREAKRLPKIFPNKEG